MELKEAIRILRNITTGAFQVVHTDALIDFPYVMQAVEIAISHLETLQKVKDAGGVKRKGVYENNYCTGWNDCLDAVHAELAGKLEGLEGQIKHWGNDSIVFTGIKDDLIQVIRSHILGTGKKEE